MSPAVRQQKRWRLLTFSHSHNCRSVSSCGGGGGGNHEDELYDAVSVAAMRMVVFMIVVGVALVSFVGSLAVLPGVLVAAGGGELE